MKKLVTLLNSKGIKFIAILFVSLFFLYEVVFFEVNFLDNRLLFGPLVGLFGILIWILFVLLLKGFVNSNLQSIKEPSDSLLQGIIFTINKRLFLPMIICFVTYTVYLYFSTRLFQDFHKGLQLSFNQILGNFIYWIFYVFSPVLLTYLDRKFLSRLSYLLK